MTPIPERARRYVAKAGPAISGAGGHTHTLLVARALVKGFLLSDGEALSILSEWNESNSEKWSPAELEHKISSAAGGPGEDGYLLKGGSEKADFGSSERTQRSDSSLPTSAFPVPTPKKRSFDLAELERQAAGIAALVDLPWLANRSETDPATVGPEEYLRRMYQAEAGEKVLVFDEYKSQGQAVWPTEKIPTSGPDGIWFLAQPVDGKRHPNPRVGKISRRSEESVLAWRWMVLESDEAPLRLWLGALVRVVPRIASITTSGGRSVHALVRVDAKTKSEWDGIKKRLLSLVVVGADPGALSAVRLTRLPGCLRGDREQKLLYFAPSAPKCPIEALFPRRDVLKLWVARVQAAALAGFPEAETRACARACRFYQKFEPWLLEAGDECERNIKK